MRDIAHSSAVHPLIQGFAMEIASAYPREHWPMAVWGRIRDTVQFREDAEQLNTFGWDPSDELLITPERLLTAPNPIGDCDDFSLLVASIFIALGIPVRYVAIAADPTQPDMFTHVYVEIRVNNAWVAFDASHGDYIGWASPGYRRTVMNVKKGLGSWDPWLEGDYFYQNVLEDSGYTQSMNNGWSDTWRRLAEEGAKAGINIAQARYGQPPEGTYTRGRQGEIFYRAPTGTNSSFPPFPITPGNNSLLPIAALVGGGLLLVVLLKGGR
jgi:hypothetical protein